MGRPAGHCRDIELYIKRFGGIVIYLMKNYILNIYFKSHFCAAMLLRRTIRYRIFHALLAAIFFVIQCKKTTWRKSTLNIDIKVFLKLFVSFYFISRFNSRAPPRTQNIKHLVLIFYLNLISSIMNLLSLSYFFSTFYYNNNPTAVR